MRSLPRRGDRGSRSPLPDATSESARRVGEQRYTSGSPIGDIALTFGSICDQVGVVGSRYNLCFDAREYRVFNQCLDAAVATAVEWYWTRDRAKQDHAKTERIGFLAHELRNYLATAEMAFARLKQGHGDIESRTSAIVDRSLTRMRTLIEKSLSAVQRDAVIEASPQLIALEELVSEVVRSAIPERNITLDVHCEDGLHIEVDPQLIVSALGNLLQNALKFTRTNGTVSLRVHGEGALVQLEVEDQCGGLPPGKQEELFKAFVRRSSDPRGVGLGLAIANEAVQRCGGQLRARSLPTVGCAFTITLPRTPAPS